MRLFIWALLFTCRHLLLQTSLLVLLLLYPISFDILCVFCLNIFSNFPFDCFLTHYLFNSMFNFLIFFTFFSHIFKISVFFLLLISSLIPLSSKRYVIFSDLNLWRLVLWLNIWSILKNILCTFEKIIYSVAVGWDILYISVTSIRLVMLFNSSVSLLIFVLDGCSICIESGVLNWNVLLLLHCYFSLQFYQCLLHIFDCSDVGCIYSYNCYSSLVTWPFYHYIIFFGSCDSFWLNVYFVLSMIIPAFFWLPFAKTFTFFHSFTFSLCVALNLKWVSFRQHVDGLKKKKKSPFRDCLFIGESNPFTFKVITHRERLTVAILKIVLSVL